MDDDNLDDPQDPFGMSIAIEFLAQEAKKKKQQEDKQQDGKAMPPPTPKILNKNEVAYYQTANDDTLSTVETVQGSKTSTTFTPKVLKAGSSTSNAIEVSDTMTVAREITMEAFQKQQDDLASLRSMFEKDMAHLASQNPPLPTGQRAEAGSTQVTAGREA